MNALEYLRIKISDVQRRISINTDTKQGLNRGCVLMANSGVWQLNLEHWLIKSEDFLANRYRTESKKGQPLKLTNVSYELGKSIAFDMGQKDYASPYIAIPLGDLVLEAFQETGFITIEKQDKAERVSKYSRSPYVVTVVGRSYTKVFLAGTRAEKPNDINSLFNDKGKSYIKNWELNDQPEFMKLVENNAVFIQALNKLQQTPWRLNKAVLDIICEHPELFVTHTLKIKNKAGQEENFLVNDNANKLKGIWYLENGSKFLKEKDPVLQRIRSKNYEYDAIIKKAKAFPETFYQDYTCDYRGRIYCSESFLQFQGTDLARGLFLFDEAKEITDSGLKRLKVHIANCYNVSLSKDCLPHYFTTDYKSILEEEGLEEISLDKLTLEDRVLFVENNYWKRKLDPKAESPVSLLAALNELHNHATIEGYKSGLPIPVDGSNNGWQHLSAMSRDRQAAELVSCTDVKVQKDFYVAVAKEMIKKNPSWFEKREIPMKHIRKGIAKRGAMTRAYSAGKARIAENMFDDCHMYGFDVKYNINEAHCSTLAGNLIDAVNDVCAGPLRLTKWLQKIAIHEIENKEDELNWITPSGFPVTYQVNRLVEARVGSSIKRLGHIKHVIQTPKTFTQEDGTVKIVADVKSYISGIAPNVVHSYDATHLAFVITRFNGCFGAVHDSFSTHASDVDELLHITKSAFIGMYKTENWFDDFKERIMKHSATFDLPNPELGNYNVEEVIEADYFFC